MLRVTSWLGAGACVLALLAVRQSASQPLPLSVAEVVQVDGGWFAMGSDDDGVAYAAALCGQLETVATSCDPERFVVEQPVHRVYLAPFRIDRTEVSHAAYQRCVLDNVCAPSSVSSTDVRVGHPSHPVVGVSWHDAKRYCEWAGGRLPGEAEWERAARGRDRRRFPWGRHYNSKLANHGAGDGQPSEGDGYAFAAPVDSYPDGRSALGLRNLAGNVWELTDARFAAYPEARVSLPAELMQQRVMRGGSWRSSSFTLRVTHREPIGERDPRPDVGFRCAYNVP